MLTQQTNPFGERYFSELSGHIFKKTSSKGVFDRFYKDTFAQPYQLYLIVGTDSGLLVEYIYQKFAKDSSLQGKKFVFFEQADALEYLPDFSHYPDWIQVLDHDVSLSDQSSDWVDYMMTKRIGLYKSIAVVDRLNDSVNQLWQQLKDKYAELKFIDIGNNYSRPFVQAQLKNFPHNNVPIKTHQNALKGKKAILIAGGPSLDKTIDWIKSVQDRFFIFTVGRVTKKLLDEGLNPDFIVSIDPHELSYDNSKHLFHFSEQAILINCYHVAPRLLSQWSGGVMYFGELYPWQKDEQNSVAVGPTVLHSALTQAAFLGCNEVYLAGADLCFYNGQTHASGSAESAVGSMGIKNLAQVETYSGDMADTDVPFARGVEALESISAYLDKKSGIKVFNLSPQAAKVPSVALCEPAEVELPSSENKRALFESMRQSLLFSKSEFSEQLADKLTIMQQERKVASKAKKIAKEGFAYISTEKKQRQESAFNKAQKSRLKLDKCLGDKANMVFHFGYNYFSEVLKPVEDENNLTQDEKLHALFHYLEGMKKSLQDYVTLIESVIQEIKFTQTELNSKSRPCDLLPKWQKNKETGRYKRWLNYHAWPKSDEQIACLEQAKIAFNADIGSTKTRQSSLLKAKAFAVDNLIEKIQAVFNTHNVESLLALKAPIKDLKSALDRDNLTLFMQAAEKAVHQPGSELTELERIEHPKLNTFVNAYLLERYIAQNNHEKALMVLEKLATYSDEYILPYADYLKLLGRADLATELALELFKKNTDNFYALLKVVHFAHAANNQAIFNDALTVALGIDPEHPELQPYVNDNNST